MTATTYENFDLLITRVPDGYQARVIYSPACEATGDFLPPFAEVDLGRQLYHAVFDGPVGTCLHIRLRLDAASIWQIYCNNFSLPMASSAPRLKPTRAFSIHKVERSQPIGSQCITQMRLEDLHLSIH